MPLITMKSLVIVFVAAVASMARADDVAIHITGAVPKPVSWTTAQIQETFAAEMHPLEYAGKDKKHTSNCVPLLAILKAAGAGVAVGTNPAADPKDKNRPLHLAVVVRGRDGYVAVFSLAELLPEIGNKPAWLAVDQDGAALTDRDAPAKLIIPTDAKPGRWVRAVAEIQVIDESKATTQP